MKFVVSSAILQKQLSALSGVIMTNPHLPILENFLFQIQEGKLTAIASDLQISMKTQLDVETSDSGSIAVPAKQLLDTLKSLPEQPVTVQVDEENNSFEITSFNGRYKLAGEPADDFPKVPQPDGEVKIELSSDVLETAISSTIFAISSDELRPAMTGLFLKLSSQEATFVATDGNRLVRYKREDITTQEDVSMIIPKKALGLLKTTLPTENEAVKAEFSQTHAFFDFEGVSLSCRLIDESFPDYENAIPKDNPNVLIIKRPEMLNSLKRLSIYANKTTNQVRFKMTANNLQVFAEDTEFFNEAQETLTCEYTGEELEIGFNVKYVVEMLSNLDVDEVHFSFSAPSRAGILVPKDQNDQEDVLMLIMPVMLNTYAS